MSKEDIRQEKSDLSQPPEYVEVEGNGSGSTGQPREESFTGEDKLSVLKTYDTVIIVDDSSSMQEQGGNGDGKSKWDEVSGRSPSIPTDIGSSSLLFPLVGT